MQKINRLRLSLWICFSVLLIPTATQADTKDKNSDLNEILIQDKTYSITKEQAKIILADMNKAQKQRMLSNPEKFKDLLIDLMILEKKTREAKNLKIDQDKVIQWKIQKRTKRILADSLIKHYKEKVVVPDDIKLLAKEYYDGHPEEYVIKETVKVAHILISTTPEKDDKTNEIDYKKKQLELSKRIIKEIKQGLAFNEAAKKYSADKGSASSGGVINFFTRGKMVKPFEEAAFALRKKDELSDITESRFGYHIIKLLDRTEKSIKSYDEVKARLIALQKKRYINNKAKAYNNSFNVDKDTTISMPVIKNFLSEN